MKKGSHQRGSAERVVAARSFSSHAQEFGPPRFAAQCALHAHGVVEPVHAHEARDRRDVARGRQEQTAAHGPSEQHDAPIAELGIARREGGRVTDVARLFLEQHATGDAVARREPAVVEPEAGVAPRGEGTAEALGVDPPKPGEPGTRDHDGLLWVWAPIGDVERTA